MSQILNIMNILNLIITASCVVLILICVALFIRIYYDITPYEAHWDIFKCLDPQCVKDKSYKCYKWCDNINGSGISSTSGTDGAAENCRLRCADYADEMFDSLKFQNYTWNYLLSRFDKVTLLKDRDDIVEWTTMDKYPHIHNEQYSRKYNGYFNKNQ